MAAIASVIGLGGWGSGSAREIPMSKSERPYHPQPVTTHHSKKRKNPMHGICGADSNRFTRHLAGDGHDTTRRHNEERRAEAMRELGRIIEARQKATVV